VRLNQQAADQVRLLVERGALRPADLILARAAVNDVQVQLGAARTALVGARRDFYRALGTLDFALAPAGTLDRPPPDGPPERLVEYALGQRPDLLARQAEVARAEAQTRFELADRIGNLTVGPMTEYNETRADFVGVQVSAPIPVFNRHQGLIAQRRAEAARARLDLRQLEIEVRQDAPAAITRVREARAWVETYQKQALPDLSKALADLERLFEQGQPGVDVLRVLDVRRTLLRAQDGLLDALWAYTQALADLAQAVGDPALAMGCYAPAGPPPAPAPPPARP
jgi:outer membrane protein, heavy metal efflux system